MDYEGIILDKEAGIATITLNRPEQLNAISPAMAQSLVRALDDIDKDDSLKVVIITGAGRGFCSGADISTFEGMDKMSHKEMGDALRRWTLPLYNFPKPTIAAINGAATGAGLSWAMLCDIRIASEKARFSSAFIRVALVPDTGASYLLPRIAGSAKAMELMLTGDIIDAAEAQRLGIVNKVVPEQELMKEARQLAERMARGPSIAIGLTKQAIKRGVHNNLEQQVEFESFAQHICLKTEDNKEAARAFFEKRQPEFKGR